MSGGLPPRQYQYRGWKELPEELVRLIRGMTHPGVSQRTSVRAARRYPYVDDVFPHKEGEETFPTARSEGKIDFLECTMKGQRAKQKQPQPESVDELHVGVVEKVDETLVQDGQVGLEL